ncbi:MAG: transposase [Mediterranea sp.]|nr:transposase [Mediterranea sp.]
MKRRSKCRNPIFVVKQGWGFHLPFTIYHLLFTISLFTISLFRACLNFKSEVWNAIFYLVKTGCQWRMLPSDFTKWQLADTGNGQNCCHKITTE